MGLNYDHYENRKGAQPITWEDFHAICRGLAISIAQFDPQVIFAIARGGLYAGTLISHMLRKDLHPIYLTRRHLDEKISDLPIWITKPPDIVKDQRVLVVDDIASSGETLRVAREQLLYMGASAVRCAVLYAHSWATLTPDYIGLISDALIINPWDHDVVEDGKIALNPEYRFALNLQNIAPESMTGKYATTIRTPAKQPKEAQPIE
jgi:uncharacterized protein